MVETLYQAFLAGGERVGHVPMGKQHLGDKKNLLGLFYKAIEMVF